MRIGALLTVFAIASLVACDDGGVSLSIEDARVSRAPDKARVVVEIDVVARERLGGNIGVYCAAVTFGGQARVVEECYRDLEDGDRKTLRFTSDGLVAERAAIDVRVRLDGVGERRALAAPPL